MSEPLQSLSFYHSETYPLTYKIHCESDVLFICWGTGICVITDFIIELQYNQFLSLYSWFGLAKYVYWASFWKKKFTCGLWSLLLICLFLYVYTSALFLKV
jgi:hypothetical protein